MAFVRLAFMIFGIWLMSLLVMITGIEAGLFITGVLFFICVIISRLRTKGNTTDTTI